MGSVPVPVHETFSKSDKERVRAWFGEGKTQAEIGVLLGVPRRTVGKLFRHLGLSRSRSGAQRSRFDPEFVRRVVSLRGRGLTVSRIAEDTDRSVAAVGRVLKKHEVKVAVDGIDRAVICREYGSGDSMHVVASRHGVSTYVVRKVLVEGGVPVRKPRMVRKRRSESVPTDLPPYEDTEEWFRNAYCRYGMPAIASFIGRGVGFVDYRLRKYGIEKVSISRRNQRLDRGAVLGAYRAVGSMSRVAARFGCTVEAVKRILVGEGVRPDAVSEMFSGGGNPFHGRRHVEETRRYCAEVGAVFGRKFWEDHPEYVEVVRRKQSELWSDLDRRRRQSLLISDLRRRGLVRSRRGTVSTRFGELNHDSSYELRLIEACDSDGRVVRLERDFDLVPYEFGGKGETLRP